MTNSEVKTVDVHYLKNMMENHSDLYLIDVRELGEWQEVRIPGALHIPKNNITSLQDKISDKSQPIYLHCHAGVRSLYAAQCLIDMGYEEVYSVNGGIMEWVMAGYPVNH